MSAPDLDNSADIGDILAHAEPRTLKFDMSPAVGETELAQLLAFAGELGLTYAGSEELPPRAEPNPVTHPVAEPAIFIPSVYPPTDPRQFFGKEHLWLTAEAAGIQKSTIAGLLNAVIFPIENFVNHWRSPNNFARPLTYQETGIVVKTRHEAGLAEASPTLPKTHYTRREMIYKQQFPGNKIKMNNAAIQYEGFIALRERPDLMTSIYTPSLITAHHTVAGRFAELIG